MQRKSGMWREGVFMGVAGKWFYDGELILFLSGRK